MENNIEDADIPFVFYFHVAHKFAEHTNQNRMSKKKAKTLLSGWNIPKKLRCAVLKEMESLGFLQAEGRQYILDEEKLSVANDISELNRMAGLWD